MAYLVMPTLGEPTTCNEPCTHTDCAITRSIVNKACEACGKPVAPGDRFVLANPGYLVEHLGCQP